MVRVPLMAGNWKMNLNHQEAMLVVQKLVFLLTDAKHDWTKTEVAVLAPFTDLRSIQSTISDSQLPLQYGAQDLSAHEAGAYTGEISGAMLRKLGCSYVIVGHSERRQYHHETDAIVAAKAARALTHELTPIVCVGEPLQVRQAGEHVSHAVAQLRGSLAGLSTAQVATCVIAYEPVWAIGTGEVATPSDAQEVCAALRADLAEQYDEATAQQVRILYGGSVNPGNVVPLMAQPDVDGGLVGGASLKPEDFAALATFAKPA